MAIELLPIASHAAKSQPSDSGWCHHRIGDVTPTWIPVTCGPPLVYSGTGSVQVHDSTSETFPQYGSGPGG
jgi:hypothetical protein